jgi:hypothetical protein
MARRRSKSGAGWLSGKDHSQGSTVGLQHKLRPTQPGIALEILQAKVPFHPGEVPLDVAARRDHQPTPLAQEEQGGKLAFALVIERFL